MMKSNAVVWVIIGLVLLALGVWWVSALFTGGHPVWGVIVTLIFIDLLADVVLNLKPSNG